MRSVSTAAAMIACLAVVGCTTQTGAGRETGPRPLEADALRVLLSDANVTPVQPADIVRSHPPGEIFRSNGTYVRIIGRTRVYGTFDILGDLVCVKGDDFIQKCRRVIPLDNGAYTLVDASDGSSMQVTITPHSRQAATIPEFRQLRGDEIRALVVGRALRHDVNRRVEGPGIVILSQYREMYRPDGTVAVLIHRAGIGGRYAISGDSLCLFLDNQPTQCRYFFRSDDGVLVQKDALDPTGGFTPIIIEGR